VRRHDLERGVVGVDAVERHVDLRQVDAVLLGEGLYHLDWKLYRFGNGHGADVTVSPVDDVAGVARAFAIDPAKLEAHVAGHLGDVERIGLLEAADDQHGTERKKTTSAHGNLLGRPAQQAAGPRNALESLGAMRPVSVGALTLAPVTAVRNDSPMGRRARV